MNTRERMLAVGVLIALVIGGGAVLFKVLYLDPLTEHNDDIANLPESQVRHAFTDKYTGYTPVWRSMAGFDLIRSWACSGPWPICPRDGE